jgi:stress up-regulated protein Nod 19
MTKRLGMFLGLGFVGVVLLLTGLAWDAVAHANDPSLAGREGIFTLRNPGHVLLGLGIGLVLVSLIGGCDTLLTTAAQGRWARPGVHRAFLAVSTAVVLSAGAVTSWAAQAGHDHPAGTAHGHDASGQLAAPVDGSHDHTEGQAAEPGAAAATDGHTHAEGGEQAATAGTDATSHAGHTSTSVVHDHVLDGREQVAAPASGAHRHDSTTTPGRPDEAAHSHEAAPATQPGDHQHATPSTQPPGPPTGPDAPQGTWAELRYGPFVVTPAGAGGDADHANIAVPSLPKPCTNCFLLEAQPDLVYADGTSANLDTGMMLHHAVLFNAGRQDPTCGPEQPFPGKLGQRFFASGNERTPGQFPPGFGYFVDGGNWSGIFHVMNHSAEAKSVFFQLKVRWSPAAAGGVHPLTPIWLDMNNCNTSEYAVPAGPSSSHWTWTSNVTGRIISTAGHVHDGGVRTTLTNQTTGQHLCTSWASWGKKTAYQGSIESMSGCTWDRVGTVQKGEVLDLESVYNSPKSVPDAMGIMMAFVFETPDLGGGTPAPPDVKGESPPPVAATPPPSSHDHH